GYHYIRVYLYEGSGIYSMTVTVAGGATQNDMGTGGDAGNYLSNATAILAGSGTGYIDSTDTDDYYKVNLIAGQTISVSMTPPTGSDFDLSLYDASQWEVDSSLLGGSQTDMVSYTATSSGYHYIRVYLYEGSGIYSMTVTVAGGATQNDAGSGQDAGDTFAQAITVQSGSYTGFVDSTDKDDYYRVSLAGGQIIVVSLSPPLGSDFDLYLYGSDKTLLDYSTLSESQIDTVTYTATSPENCYVRVERWSGSGVYSFTVWLSSVSVQNDWNSGMDAGNSLAQAIAVSSGSGMGYLDSTDTEDYYRIRVASGVEICAVLDPPLGSDFDLYLYDQNGIELSSSILSGSQTDTINYTSTYAGDFYIRVCLWSGSGIYSLQISASSADFLAESPHPYPNLYDQTWVISEPGAGKIRVHFTQLDVEEGWDYVYIYDGNNNLIGTYTGSYRDLWTDWVTGDTIKVRLVSDYLITAYGFTIDRKETGEAPPPPSGNKFAILVGVNDYIDPYINDLVGCVEDAMDWRTYLVSKGYQISYFLADRQATEANIKQAIASVVAQAGPDSTIVFAFSGHGAKSQEVGLPAGNSVICASDSGFGTNGNITDLELRDAFAGYTGRLMVFLDSCRSGGMNEVVTGNASRYMTTACSDDGYGFGIPWYQNGAWGYWFVDRGLVRGGSGHQDMEGNFSWARPAMINDVLAGTEYNTPNNYPQQFDGDPTGLFTL
ncbi:MAG: pre-peptidase C-terminal domain-containing protein, partial [Candidatus Hadarchaeales archaeon]